MRDVASPGIQTLRAVPLRPGQKFSLMLAGAIATSDGRLSVVSAHPTLDRSTCEWRAARPARKAADS